MNQREKLLVGAVGGVAGLFGLILAIRGIIVKPLQDVDKRIALVREKTAKLQTERRNYFASEDRLKAITQRAFGDSIEQASAASGEMLTRQILSSGLQESDFTRLPLGPRKLRGASEIGWNIQGSGSLSNVVNLLFILDNSPWLHRSENLVVSTGESPGAVKVRLRYMTLIIDPAPDVTRTNLVAAVGLDSQERHLLNSIVSRDLLRPYIKQPPPPPQPGQPAPPPGQRNSPPGPENFKIVSLSEWEGKPEIHVRDLTAQTTARFKPGDDLGGGKIVMVDYRPMPQAGNPSLQSYSRLILKIDQDYWAVERGKTLAQKRKLPASELPPQLVSQQ